MPRAKRMTTAMAIGMLFLGILGCSGGEDGSNEEIGQDSPATPGDSAVLSTTEPAQLDDAAIAATLAAADTAEIAPSELARERAQEPQVRQFAEMMVRDHGMLSDSLRALIQAQGIAPDPGHESEVLETHTRAMVEGLQGLSGATFDSAYVASMVQSHEAALNAIDSQLLSAAANPALRTAIEQKVRPTVAAHLEQAEQIQGTLNGQ